MAWPASFTCGARSPLWRGVFDTVERPVAAFLEASVQTDTFMQAFTVGWRVQRRLTRDLQRTAAFWLAVWDVPTGRDVSQLVNQVAAMERLLREWAE